MLYSRLEKRPRGLSDLKSVAFSDQKTPKKERSESPVRDKYGICGQFLAPPINGRKGPILKKWEGRKSY
jgi:hypothetical protein